MLDSLMLSDLARSSLELAAQTYSESVDLAGYFLGNRGITEQAARGFHLGAVSADNALPGHERFIGMLCLPYLSEGGVLALKFRHLDGDSRPKYDQPSGQTPRLYNVLALSKGADVVAVCEGELDAIVCESVLGIPAIGVPGASNWQSHWKRCFADVAEVIVVSDHDVKDDGSDPGLKHAKRVVSEIGSAARLVLPPAGCDLGEWVLSAGAEEVKEKMGV